MAVTKLTKEATKSLFAKAKEGAARAGMQLPVGKYTGKIISCALGENKDQVPMVTTEFEVTEGEYKGVKHRIYNNITDEYEGKSLEVLLSIWHKLGYDISKINDLSHIQEHCEDITSSGYYCTFQIALNKKNPDYTNTYFKEMIQFEAPEVVVEQPTAPPVVEAPKETAKVEEKKIEKQVKTKPKLAAKVEAPKVEEPVVEEIPETTEAVEEVDHDANDDGGEEEVELSIGATIQYLNKGKKLVQAVVVAVDDEAQTVTVDNKDVVALSSIQSVVG